MPLLRCPKCPRQRSLARLTNLAAPNRRTVLIINARLRSMTTDYNTPIDESFELLGANRYSLDKGISRTVESLRNYAGPDARGGRD